jgi:hypothetical protein
VLAASTDRLDALAGALTRVAGHPGVDTVGARRRIGTGAVGLGRYPF